MDSSKRYPRKPPSITKSQAKLLSMPFLSDELIGSKPLSCSAVAFEIPKLRKCPFDLNRIDWTKSHRIGGGLDGYVWKIWLDDHPYAMKLFWDTAPMLLGSHYYAAQRECQNNALLQQIDAAIKETAPGSPILINPNPKTKIDALDNTFEFTQEGRQIGFSDVDVDYQRMGIPSMPRMTQCYGWAKVSSPMISRDNLPPTIYIEKTPRFMEPNKEHIAIIYEYIDESESENDPATVEEAANFFWRVGFGHNGSSLARNWKGGMLVDFSDIVHASGYGWHVTTYGPRKASEILNP